MSLFESLQNLVYALIEVFASAAHLVLPWTPLIVWIAFWTLAVDWSRLYPVLRNGGLVGVLLTGFAMILVWGVIAPPTDGQHVIFGLHVSNFVGKFVYVAGLITIMFLCGSVQSSGCCDRYVCFSDPEPEPSHAHGGPSDHDGGHGHGDHSHAASHH